MEAGAGDPGDDRAAVWPCRIGLGQPGLESGEGCEGQQERLLQYINSTRNTRENVAHSWMQRVCLVTQDTEKAKVLDAFCASVFTGKSVLGLPVQER